MKETETKEEAGGQIKTTKPVLQRRGRGSPAPRSHPGWSEDSSEKPGHLKMPLSSPLRSSPGTVTGLRESSERPSKNHYLEAGFQRHHKLHDFYDEVWFQNSPN